MRRYPIGGVAALAVLAATIAGPAGADTLREALGRTYQANPTMTGARSRLRALDEQVAIARAEGRPQVGGTVGLTQDFNGIARLRNGGRALTAAVDLDYPIFNGGRVRSGIRAADARVAAGRAGLRATEGDVFTEAVGAYMDVIRDQSIVQLNENQVRVLSTDVQASRDRFSVGDLTRTDVAQSEARLSGARSQLATAQGRLTSSRENYRRITGLLPVDLQPPPPLPPLPATADQATQVALANNPGLAAIGASAQAAGYDVSTARAGRLPTLSANTGASYSNFLGTLERSVDAPSGVALDNTQTDTRVGLTARIPLYQGGGTAARVRQAQALQSQVLEQVVETERFVIADARAAFASYQAANDTIRSSEQSVAANRLALEGTRAEAGVGTRNVLDVLNAEQELLNSEVLLVTARRDAYVAGFALLNAMGRAEARDLGLDGGALYDPVANYDRVSRRSSDWGNDPTPTTQATRTIDQPVASPVQGPVTPRPN